MALKFVPRLAVHKKLALVEQHSITTLFTDTPSQKILNVSDKQYHAIISPNWSKITKIIEQTDLAHAKIIHYEASNYPQTLKEIYDPPLVLFIKGNDELLNQQQLAIVGSRNASHLGRETAYRFAQELSLQGLVITSGLALGIDSHAHKGVVDKALPTIGVIATGIDICYPTRHKQLAKSIVENGGAIITEFIPNTEAKPGHFPKRNRIISGMSYGVLLIEATIKSGSLITARCALEQNRDVFAVPGSINNPQSKGCHWLIKQGAKLVDETADIIEELSDDVKNGLHLTMNKNSDASRNNKINKEKAEQLKKSCEQDLFNDSLLASVGYEITPVDTVVSRSKLPTDVVLTRLTMLELRGLVSAVPGGYLKN